MISTVIVTINEEDLLKDCLASVASDSNEIIIVDLGSSDNTKKIARDFKAKIFSHSRVEYVEQVRDFAVSCALGDWILVLDPDERMTPALWKKLKEIVSEDRYSAVNIPRKNIFFNRWIAHTNWWPDKHVRFFKKGQVSWNSSIHHYPKVLGKVLNLSGKGEIAIIHLGYKTISEFIDRQNRYAGIKAKNLFDLGERFSWINFFLWPVREFLVRFIKHLGFLDGFLGFALTFLMMVYQLQVMIGLWELEKEK